jgi:hypothetical protein
MTRAFGLAGAILIGAAVYWLLARYVIGTRWREWQPDPDLRDACARWQARTRRGGHHV